MCMVEGTAHLRLVPHVSRMEIYAGQSYFVEDNHTKEHSSNKDNILKEESQGTEVLIEPFESPVNMFSWDKEAYPNVNLVHHKYGEVLKAGDCMFVPAFYFV